MNKIPTNRPPSPVVSPATSVRYTRTNLDTKQLRLLEEKVKKEVQDGNESLSQSYMTAAHHFSNACDLAFDEWLWDNEDLLLAVESLFQIITQKTNEDSPSADLSKAATAAKKYLSDNYDSLSLCLLATERHSKTSIQSLYLQGLCGLMKEDYIAAHDYFLKACTIAINASEYSNPCALKARDEADKLVQGPLKDTVYEKFFASNFVAPAKMESPASTLDYVDPNSIV